MPRETAAFPFPTIAQIDPLDVEHKRRLAQERTQAPTNATLHRTPTRRALPSCTKRATTSCADNARQAPVTNPLDSFAINPNERLPSPPFDLHPLEHLGAWGHHRDSSETCRSPAGISPPHSQPKESLERPPGLILDRPPMN